MAGLAQEAIFGPVFGMFVLTMVVWVYMYAKRIPLIQSLDLAPDELTPEALARHSPPAVSNPSDNLKNLFEMPVLFYVLSGWLYVTAAVDAFYLWAAWAYLALRVLHSGMHCTRNVVLVRFWLYGASCLVLFVMIFRAGWQLLAG